MIFKSGRIDYLTMMSVPNQFYHHRIKIMRMRYRKMYHIQRIYVIYTYQNYHTIYTLSELSFASELEGIFKLFTAEQIDKIKPTEFNTEEIDSKSNNYINRLSYVCQIIT